MEHGGCCLTQHRTLSSKADRFMSRYRPIAPKPRALTMPSLPDIHRALSSGNSLDTTGCRSVPDTCKSRRRVRKRRGDSLTPPQFNKKAATSSGRSDCSKEQSSVSTCAAGSGFTGAAFAEVGRAAVDPFSAACLFAANGSSSMTMANGEMSDASVLGGACVAAESGAIDKAGLIGGNQSMLQDTGFMKRAAASTPASGLPERGIITFCSGGFTEMIRGITRFPRTTDVANLMHPSGSPVSTMRSNPTDFGRECFAFAGVPSFCAALVEGENKMAVVELQHQQDKDGNSNLVTLPLLPGPSSRSDSSLSSISTGSSLTQFRDLNSKHENGIRVGRFRPLSDEPRAYSEQYDYPKSSICDIALIRQVYGTSQEPVLLMDDSRNALWCNRAYERAFKKSMDRQPRKTPRVVPFIDPLGIPTQLGKVNVQLPGCGFYYATLWGFLKKIVVDAGTEVQDADSPLESWPSPKELKLNSSPDVTCRLGNGSGNPDREGCCDSGVIVPQPVRPVGSTVSLESVTDIHKDARPLSESLVLVKKELEEGNLPAFITDSSNKVRWVNTAYKQMIGQPECSWLVSTVNTIEMPGILPSPRLIGEILLTNSVEIPTGAPAFSGRANIQWTNTGERNCMTVPCDVCRLNSCKSGANALSLVWKFDIDASLRLTCGR